MLSQKFYNNHTIIGAIHKPLLLTLIILFRLINGFGGYATALSTLQVTDFIIIKNNLLPITHYGKRNQDTKVYSTLLW